MYANYDILKTIDTILHNLIILKMFKVVMTWPEWKMGYFKKKRKGRIYSSTKSIKLLTSQNPPTKNCGKFECLAWRGNAQLSISSLYDMCSVFKHQKMSTVSVCSGKMGAYWAVRLPIPVTISESQTSIGCPQAISFWHIVSIYSPICSFIKGCIIRVIYTPGMRQFL